MPLTDAEHIDPPDPDNVDSEPPPADWLQVHLEASADQAPFLETALENLGALSVTFGDAGDEPIFEPMPGETPLWRHTRITALFEGDRSADALRESIVQTLPEHAGRLRFERLRDEPWERAWLKDFHPMTFGGRLRVAPGEQTSDADGLVTVRLEPGLAFGTGTHSTTALCLRWLDKADLAGKTLMDYGCGSGILAIAALRLGAAAAIAVDRDPQALAATRNNARRNGVLDRLSLDEGARPPGGRVDILIANILSGTLIALCGPLTAGVHSGGTIVLSGILAEQADEVARAFQSGFEMQPPVTEEEWVLLEGRRKP